MIAPVLTDHDKESWRGLIVRHLNDEAIAASHWAGWSHFRRVRWAREIVARATGPADIAELSGAIDDLRYHCFSALLNYHGIYRSSDSRLEELMPRSSVLADIGLALDGTMERAADADLLKEPLALLGLDPDHPALRDRHRLDPIRNVVRWADTRSDSPDAAEVQQAWLTYRAERRFAATYAELDLEDTHVVELFVSYDELTHAFGHVFDGRLADVPLAALMLEGTTATRLATALALDADEVAEVGDLPTRFRQLEEAPRIGAESLLRLKRGLVRVLSTWRPRTMNVDESLIVRGEHTEAELKEGLDELASLFLDGE